MAVFDISYYSEALRRYVPFQAFLPFDYNNGGQPPAGEKYASRPMGALFLLHGFTGSAFNFVPQELCYKYNFAVIMPNGENSFYTDHERSCAEYCKMVGAELVDFVRRTLGLAKERELTGIAGFSMGGYGALHVGLKYSQTFAKIGAMSSALIVKGLSAMKPGEGNSVANYDYYSDCFGPLSAAPEREVNPEVQIKKLKNEKASIPGLYLCCGEEDFLIEPNRDFHAFLQNEGIDHLYTEGPGIHNWAFWDRHIQEILAWLPLAKD